MRFVCFVVLSDVRLDSRKSLTVISQVMRVNLDAVFVLARDIGAYMLTRLPDEDSPHRGSIINVASLVSFQGGLNVPAYAAAKGGVAQLTKSLSNQWASRGINVNAVRYAFGTSETPLSLTRRTDSPRIHPHRYERCSDQRRAARGQYSRAYPGR